MFIEHVDSLFVELETPLRSWKCFPGHKRMSVGLSGWNFPIILLSCKLLDRTRNSDFVRSGLTKLKVKAKLDGVP